MGGGVQLPCAGDSSLAALRFEFQRVKRQGTAKTALMLCVSNSKLSRRTR